MSEKTGWNLVAKQTRQMMIAWSQQGNSAYAGRNRNGEVFISLNGRRMTVTAAMERMNNAIHAMPYEEMRNRLIREARDYV